jgi:hypothetical protein
VKTKYTQVLLIAACLLIAASAAGMAQDQVLYKGQPIDGSSMAVGSWGSGRCEDVAKSGYTGTHSLKITARSLYEGGRLDFAPALDLTKHFKNPNAYIQLIAKMQLDTTNEEDPLLSDYYDPSAASALVGTPVSRVRLVMKLETGPAFECQVDVTGLKVGDDGWTAISFPLSAFKGKQERAEYRIKRLVISGDGSEPFYVGQIHIITDTKPIIIDPGLGQFVAANDDVMFRPHSDGGAAALRYAWDFDSDDGIQEDAIGEVVYHKYRKAGDYTVTLTASDVFGIKKSVAMTVKIEVFD